MKFRHRPLADQTIVITGASSGIGLATATEAARRGARVILVSRNEEALDSIAADIRARGGRADYVAADVGDRPAVRRVVDTVIERHGGFDTWVNNAGVGVYATLEDTTDEDHERLFRTNYWGVVYGSLEALRHLKPKGGTIINIGSIASDIPTPVLSAYAASKHAVKGFTHCLRAEMLHEGTPVSVSLIRPSGTYTPYSDHAHNYMDVAARVPPPVYHPRLVANAILHAAETPTRDIVVGGVGRLQTGLAQLLPKVAERVFDRAFFDLARDPQRPKRHRSSLHEPGEDGDILGTQSGYVRGTSLYTASQMHPRATAALALAVLAAAGLGAAGLARRRRRMGLPRR